MSGINQEQEAKLAQKRRLGWTLATEAIAPNISLGRDLVLQRNPTHVVLERVEGIDALTQKLTHALTMLYGSDVFNTRWGFNGLNAMAEQSEPLLQREAIRTAVVAVLRDEPRVARINDVKLLDDRLSLPAAGDRRALAVTVSFTAVTGETLNINLNTVSNNGSTN